MLYNWGVWEQDGWEFANLDSVWHTDRISHVVDLLTPQRDWSYSSDSCWLGWQMLSCHVLIPCPHYLKCQIVELEYQHFDVVYLLVQEFAHGLHLWYTAQWPPSVFVIHRLKTLSVRNLYIFCQPPKFFVNHQNLTRNIQCTMKVCKLSIHGGPVHLITD